MIAKKLNKGPLFTNLKKSLSSQAFHTPRLHSSDGHNTGPKLDFPRGNGKRGKGEKNLVFPKTSIAHLQNVKM